MDQDFIDEVLDDFSEGDILLLQNEINNLAYLIDRAYEKEMFIALNPSPINEDLLAIDLNKINLIVMNETEAVDICEKTVREDIVDYLKDTYPDLKVIITFGKDGSIYFDESLDLVQKAYEVDAVDTTGAGDTFTGYFVGLLADGFSEKECLDCAAKASALAVTVKGASNSIPEFADVKRFKE